MEEGTCTCSLSLSLSSLSLSLSLRDLHLGQMVLISIVAITFVRIEEQVPYSVQGRERDSGRERGGGRRNKWR